MADIYRIFPDMNHLPLWMAQPVGNVAQGIGLPADQLRFALCLVASLFFGAVHRYVPSTSLRHIYSAAIGVFYCWFVTGVAGAVHPLVSSTVAYVMAMTLPRKVAPLAILAFAMVYLSASHIYRLWTDYLGWNLDYTTAQMMVTVKVSTFAWNWADGQAFNAGEKTSTHEPTEKFRRERALAKLPSLLEYYSYIFFFGGVLAGPCYEIKEYLDFTDRTMFQKAGLKSVPMSLTPTVLCVGRALLAYVGVFLSAKVPLMGYCETKAFQEDTTVWFRIMYIILGTPFFRFKYYFAWYLSEAGCVASGFGFNGFHDKANQGVKVAKWNRVTNCHALQCEMASCLPQLTNNWNMGVNVWLKYYVYFRVEPGRAITRYIPEALFRNLVTKFVSALWHGFYPAYYLFFVSAAFISEVEGDFRRIFRPIFHKKVDGVEVPHSIVTDIIYNFLGWFCLFSVLNYLGLSFVLLRADWSINLWRSVYFYGHVVMAVALLLTRFVFRTKRSKSQKGEAKAEAKAETKADGESKKSM